MSIMKMLTLDCLSDEDCLEISSVDNVENLKTFSYINKVAFDNHKASFPTITGTAAVGKSTLLNKLRAAGYNVISRGDVGSFQNKTTSAGSVCGLHAALSFSLGGKDCVGDRGHVDNWIWLLIMEW